jgi:protein-disulfide isomerase
LRDKLSEKFTCKHCGKSFDTKEALDQHIGDAHEKTKSESKKKTPVKKYLVYAVLALIVIGFVYGVYLLVVNSQKIGSQNINNFSPPSYSINRGSDSANVTIVELGDYQCPVCKDFFLKTESQLLQDYVTTGKAKFYFVDFAFLSQDSFTLAQGSWCANDQGKYYEYYDYIYTNQGTENTGWGTPDKVKTFASQISGLNATQFGACLDSNKYLTRVQDESNLAQSYGISATPTFLVGKLGSFTELIGDQPYSTFQQTINGYLNQ